MTQRPAETRLCVTTDRGANRWKPHPYMKPWAMVVGRQTSGRERLVHELVDLLSGIGGLREDRVRMRRRVADLLASIHAFCDFT